MTAALTACALAAMLPWWLARGFVGERAAALAGAGGRPGGAGGRPGRAGGRPGRAAAEPTPEPEVEAGVIVALLAAVLGAGAPIPRALDAVGRAIGGVTGAGLARVGAELLLGAGWERAWVHCPDRLGLLRAALGPAWKQGAPPGDALRRAEDDLRRARQAAGRRAAARLAVHLILPLGCCFLPAFVLIGLVPVLVSLGVDLLS